MPYREIADAIGYTELQVRGWINNHLPRKNRTFNDRYFNDISTPNQAYWLGFIYADGWISSHKRSNGQGDASLCYEFGIELQRQDEYILHEFNQQIGGVHTVYQRTKSPRVCDGNTIGVTESSVIRIYSNPFVQGLLKNGIDFNKTNSERFPVVSDSLFPDFLRGYIDGDGCIYEMKPGKLAVHITNANQGALIHIQRRLSDLYDIHTSLYSETERKHRLCCFRVNDVRKLLDVIYYDPQSIKLTRKYNKYLNFYGLAA